VKVSESIKIFSALSATKSNGMTIISLSRESEIDISVLRKCLTKNKDFFVRVGEKQIYTINRFSKYKGDIERMIVAVEDMNQSKASNMYLYFILMAAVFTTLMANLVINK